MVGKVEGESQQPKWMRADIKKTADGESDMREKLKQRYQEQYDAVKERMDVETHDEMVKRAKEEVKARQRVHIGEHRKVTDDTVLIDPKAAEIQAKRKELEEQTTELYNRINKEILPTYKTLEHKITPLAGRVKVGPPPKGDHPKGASAA